MRQLIARAVYARRPVISEAARGSEHMAQAGRAYRRRIAIGLAALALLAGCSRPLRQDSAEREFNAWANQVQQANDKDPANGSVDFEEPSNVLARVVPANGQ
jgi:hypothetical protein